MNNTVIFNHHEMPQSPPISPFYINRRYTGERTAKEVVSRIINAHING